MTTLFNNTSVTSATPNAAPAPRKKQGWLPLLTVLFCLSYGLMTMLIVEQGATIESQRMLIREFLRDSVELAAFKQKAQQEKALAGGQSASSPKTQAPVIQNPSSRVPSAHAPSSQAAPRHQTEKQKPQSQMPSRRAADWGDNRRALITI